MKLTTIHTARFKQFHPDTPIRLKEEEEKKKPRLSNVKEKKPLTKERKFRKLMKEPKDENKAVLDLIEKLR